MPLIRQISDLRVVWLVLPLSIRNKMKFNRDLITKGEGRELIKKKLSSTLR